MATPNLADDRTPMDTLAQLRAGKLAGIKRLDLSCGLTEFPEEIFQLADSLEVLNLTGNALSSLPDDLSRLSHLRILFCSDNLFTELPACLGQCQQLSMIGFKANRIRHVPAQALPPLLRWLILTDNCIESLPDELGNCHAMQKLMLAGNQLRSLPRSLENCHRLELLRIAANQLTELPDWLLALPSLAWLAYSGNPLSVLDEASAAHQHRPIRQIPWTSLRLGQQLGEGASGIIRQALWQAPDQQPRQVAVKLYKGSVTSDGSPLHEMAACIAAGDHPQLIRVEGQVSEHPEGQAALVMQLIAPEFLNMAALPSLDSCSRDIYPADTRFSFEVALRMARGIASVAEHLHASGITHGDLYGHNILWRADGDCLLGDFGAASFYPNPELGLAMERIEVRAFGILLGELLERCEYGAEQAAVIEQLQDLRDRCMQDQVKNRPTFAALHRELIRR